MTRPSSSSGRAWWLALGGAALAVSAGLGGLVALRARALAPAPVEPRMGCSVALLEVRALSDAESERVHQKGIHLARWNKLTEWFAALAGRYQAEAPGPVTAASKRLEQLSRAFEAAARQGAVDR